jgi:hypothetical protein
MNMVFLVLILHLYFARDTINYILACKKFVIEFENTMRGVRR